MTTLTCPHCGHPVTPDNDFETSDGSHYHILCYQAACLAAGMPDPYPVCDKCKGIVWHHTNGELDLVVRGLVKDGDEWRSAGWHPECAPSEEQLDIIADEHPEPVETHDAPPLTVASGKNDIDTATGKPLCPACGKLVQRTPTILNDTTYHRTCAARAQVAAAPTKARDQSNTKRPKCPVCKKGVTPDADDTPEDRARDIVCADESGAEVHYHRPCYRKAMVAAGLPDPYPPPDTAAIHKRLSEGREKAQRAKKEATVVCGICDVTVLRAAYPDHIVPCAEKARAAALTASV